MILTNEKVKAEIIFLFFVKVQMVQAKINLYLGLPITVSFLKYVDSGIQFDNNDNNQKLVISE